MHVPVNGMATTTPPLGYLNVTVHFELTRIGAYQNSFLAGFLSFFLSMVKSLDYVI